MKIKTLLITLIVCLYTSNAAASDNEYQSYGPNDCLLNSTDNCPIGFLVKAVCFRDDFMCRTQPFTTSYYFQESYFINIYRNVFFSTTSFIQILRNGLFNSFPTETLHEMFEYAICDISPDSCYPEGDNGLTIYTTIEDCEDGGTGSIDNDCQGGPTDSAICQVTPEACSGVFDEF